MERFLELGYYLAEHGYLPDTLIRYGIRRQLIHRLNELKEQSVDTAFQRHVEAMRSSVIAANVEKANEQHYEVPPEFFQLVLGTKLKYSSGYFDPYVSIAHAANGLDNAESAMLELSCTRAELSDGQHILELGCGWGSLTLTMAQKFPNATIVAVSNSADRKRYIDEQAENRNLQNIVVVTADVNDFDPLSHSDVVDFGKSLFDRVVSIEMFEHTRNWEHLLQRISKWIAPKAKLFLHVFCHREYSYFFEVEDASDWMAKYFFTGGIMPTPLLFNAFKGPFRLLEQWKINGTHYQLTSEAWLQNLDLNRDKVIELFDKFYGPTQGATWYYRWRLFFLAVAECFGMKNGTEWYVTHQTMELDSNQ